MTLAIFVAAARAGAEPLPQQPTSGHWLYDTAGLMSQSSRDRIEVFLTIFRYDRESELFAVSVPDLAGESINAFATRLFEQWKIGQRTQGKGLLFVLAVKEQLVRFEVGYALEPLYTDAFVSYIEHEQMVPFFEQGRVGDGFEATLELIIQRGMDQDHDGGSIPSGASSQYLTGGAGAKTGVAIGSQPVQIKPTIPTQMKGGFSAQPTPEATFALYLDHARQRITDPDLGIFTPETRQFLRQRLVTNAQLDNDYRTYSGKLYELRTSGDRAVIRFPMEERTLAPHFLRRGGEGWQIDLATMADVISFNMRNQWHFVTYDHPYMFAFRDWGFDANGFPSSNGTPMSGRAYLGTNCWWYGYQGQGVLIYDIVPGSSAASSDLEVGDIVLSYDGKPITEPADFSHYVQASRPGQTVELVLVRGALREPVSVEWDDGIWREVIPKTPGLNPPQKLRVRVTLGSR